MTEATKMSIKRELSIISESSNSANFDGITLTADIVKKKVINNEYVIKTVAKRSDVWKIFGLVCNTKMVMKLVMLPALNVRPHLKEKEILVLLYNANINAKLIKTSHVLLLVTLEQHQLRALHHPIKM